MEQTCEFCRNAEFIYYKRDGTERLGCNRGFDTYVECQVAGTDNYFEPRGSSVLREISMNSES